MLLLTTAVSLACVVQSPRGEATFYVTPDAETSTVTVVDGQNRDRYRAVFDPQMLTFTTKYKTTYNIDRVHLAYLSYNPVFQTRDSGVCKVVEQPKDRVF